MSSYQMQPPSSWSRNALVKFELTRLEKANYGINRKSRLLEVSRSGYCKWKKAQAVWIRGDNQRQRFLKVLDKHIHDIWRKPLEVYGDLCISAELVEKDIMVNRKTVAKRLRMMGIEGISLRPFISVATI